MLKVGFVYFLVKTYFGDTETLKLQIFRFNIYSKSHNFFTLLKMNR